MVGRYELKIANPYVQLSILYIGREGGRERGREGEKGGRERREGERRGRERREKGKCVCGGGGASHTFIHMLQIHHCHRDVHVYVYSNIHHLNQLTGWE